MPLSHDFLPFASIFSVIAHPEYLVCECPDLHAMTPVP